MKTYSLKAFLIGFIIALIAGLSFLLSSCSGLQSQVRGISHIYRSDSIHTIFHYDRPTQSTIKVDY